MAEEIKGNSQAYLLESKKSDICEKLAKVLIDLDSCILLFYSDVAVKTMSTVGLSDGRNQGVEAKFPDVRDLLKSFNSYLSNDSMDCAIVKKLLKQGHLVIKDELKKLEADGEYAFSVFSSSLFVFSKSLSQDKACHQAMRKDPNLPNLLQDIVIDYAKPLQEEVSFFGQSSFIVSQEELIKAFSQAGTKLKHLKINTKKSSNNYSQVSSCYCLMS